MTAHGNPDDRRKRDIGTVLNDGDTLCRLADTLWELVLDQWLSIPEVGSLTLTHLRLLLWIRDHQPVTLLTIHQEFGISQPLAARITGKLLKRGLLSRCGDLFDRHTVYLYLSDMGLRLLTRMETCQKHGLQRVMNQLTSEELHRLSKGIDLILDYDDTDECP